MARILFRKVMVLAYFTAILIFFIDGMNPILSLGLVGGAALSGYKTRLFELLLALPSNSARSAGVRAAILTAVLQITVFASLAVAILINFRLFCGMAAGLLMTTAFIMVDEISTLFNKKHRKAGN